MNVVASDKWLREHERDAELRAAERRFFWHRVFRLEDELRAFDVPVMRAPKAMELEVHGRTRGAALIGFAQTEYRRPGRRAGLTLSMWVDVFDRSWDEGGVLPATVARYSLEHVDSETSDAARWLASRFARRPVDPYRLKVASDFPKAITERALAEREGHP